MRRDDVRERRRTRSARSPGRWIRERFFNVVALLGLGASAATIIAFGAARWWAFDLASHFRVQYLAGLLAAAVAMTIARRRRWAGGFGVAAVVNLAVIVPQYLPRAVVPAGTEASVRFMQVNVRTSNTAYDRVAAEIARVDPDVLVLQELDAAWMEGLADALGAFGQSIVRVRSDNFGIGVFSRLAMEGAIGDIGDSSLPSIVARVGDGDAAFTLIATHPLPPKGRDYSLRRNRQLEAVADRVNQIAGPVVVLGDLNATPWSAPFRSLLRTTGLRDASRGRGIHATWPANFPLMLIPIDHFLHSEEITVIDERVGANVGSDHYPLVVEARLR